MNELVTIQSFTYAHEAAIVRARLEAEGVLCFLKDEFTIQMNPFYSNALGGVKLLVRKEDEELAKEILKEVDFTQTGETATNVIEQEALPISENGKPKCPYCGSHEVSEEIKPSGPVFAISFFLLGFPLPFFSSKYHCFNCGKNFKKEK